MFSFTYSSSADSGTGVFISLLLLAGLCKCFFKDVLFFFYIRHNIKRGNATILSLSFNIYWIFSKRGTENANQLSLRKVNKCFKVRFWK